MTTPFAQCKVAHAVRFFGATFMKRHGLVPYRDPEAPTIFRGLYTAYDYKRLWSHKGPAMVIWCGADAQRLNKQQARRFLARPEIKHLCMSRSLARDLDRVSLPYKRINLHGSELTDLPLSPIGTNVYVFLPKGRAPAFRPDLVQKVRARLPSIPFIVVDDHLKHKRAQLVEVYKASAIGLRLTSHDGCANTVLEMGMMGRYVVHNGDQPNAIRWKTVGNIVAAIKKQVDKTGRTHNWMRRAMRRYLDLPLGWLTVEFWE